MNVVSAPALTSEADRQTVSDLTNLLSSLLSPDRLKRSPDNTSHLYIEDLTGPPTSYRRRLVQNGHIRTWLAHLLATRTRQSTHDKSLISYLPQLEEKDQEHLVRTIESAPVHESVSRLIDRLARMQPLQVSGQDHGQTQAQGHDHPQLQAATAMQNQLRKPHLLTL